MRYSAVGKSRPTASPPSEARATPKPAGTGIRREIWTAEPLRYTVGITDRTGPSERRKDTATRCQAPTRSAHSGRSTKAEPPARSERSARSSLASAALATPTAKVCEETKTVRLAVGGAPMLIEACTVTASRTLDSSGLPSDQAHGIAGAHAYAPGAVEHDWEPPAAAIRLTAAPAPSAGAPKTGWMGPWCAGWQCGDDALSAHRPKPRKSPGDTSTLPFMLEGSGKLSLGWAEYDL